MKDREVSVKDEDSMIVVWQSLGMMRRSLYCFMVGDKSPSPALTFQGILANSVRHYS